MGFSKNFFRYREAAKIVSIYIFFGFSWIYFSDTIVGWMVHNEKIITIISILKGVFFIVFTSCLLFFLIVRLQDKINQSTNKLRESEEKFRFLVKNSSDSLVIFNADGSQKYVSPASERITGFSVSELEGRALDSIIHPDDIANVMAAWDEVLTNPKNVITVQYRHIHKTDGWVYSEAIAQSFLNEPAINGVIASVRDITKQKKTEDLLRLRESYLSAMIENLPGLIWLKDTEGRFLTVNSKFANSCGLNDSQLLVGKTDLDIWPKDLAKKYIADDAEILRSKTTLNKEEVIFDKGQRRWFETFKTPISDNQDIVIGSAGYARDITERRRAEEALKSNYALLQIASETAKFGGWSVDLEKNICTWSDAVAEIHDMPFGYSPSVQEAIQFYAPKWRKKITQCFNSCAKEGNSYDEEMEIITQEGKHVWVRATGRAVKNEKEQIIKVQGSFQDITEKKQAEEALRESEEKLHSLFSAMTEMVVVHELVFDDKGMPCNYRILDCNQAFCQITKIKKETAIGKTATEVYKTDSAPYIDLYAGVALSGESDEFVTYYAPMDKHFLVSVVSPRKNLFATITSDITEIKKSQAEREKLQDQLNQSQKMESVGRLAGGIAHDFNNMLSVIIGYAELALEKIDPASPLYANVNSIQQAGKRSADLTRQLLAFARKQTIAPKVIDINDIIEGMLSMLRRLIGEDVDLLWHPGRNVQSIKIDPCQIDQLLANLCVNARDAIDGVGKITLETSEKSFDEDYCQDHPEAKPGDYVLLEVSDNGCGMDKKTMNHIFEPFFTTKEEGQGTGLGLASIYGMIKQNNGFIYVYSELGQGTTFKIYLPVSGTKSAEVSEKPIDNLAEHGNETILLVEDESAILEMTTTMLERIGFRVLAAATPSEAIRLANEYRGRIDLLMTDVVMPEMNGRVLAENLLSHYPDIKRLFMSGYTANVIAHHGVLDDNVHFIQKPFSKKDLGMKLREVLES
nr:PAS domain S-box protein [uncultured Desulfobulbus sp.]